MRLAGNVVFLADELVVVQDVELLAGAELLAAHHAREAVEVEHLVPRLAHQVARRDTLRAASAFGAVSPARKHNNPTASEPVFHEPADGCAFQIVPLVQCDLC